MRRLWQADNDNEDPSRGPLQGYDLEGKPVYAARFQTSGNLALKPLDNPDPLFCPIRFQGQWADEESGLYYNRFRYYDPLTAQYLSPDPIGILGGLNSQAYVHNPGSWVDPLGLAPNTKCCKKIDIDRCNFLSKKIANLGASITRRLDDLDKNVLGLPERIGPGEKLSETRRGHRVLITKDWRQREKYQTEYDEKCK